MDNLPHFFPIVATYLIGFAALHSLMASLKAKRVSRRLFGSRVDLLYSAVFITMAAVTALLLFAMLILMTIVDPDSVLYIIPTPWIWFFFLAQLLVGLVSLKAFLDAPHRFLIRAQLTGPHGSDAFPLGIKGICYRIRDQFLLSGLLIIWMTPFITVNLLLIASGFFKGEKMRWDTKFL